jgi:hypothetical protein
MTCQDLSRPVKTCQDLSRPVKTCQDLSRPVKTFQDLSRPVKTCQDLSRPVMTCQDLSRPVKTFQDLSRPVKICPGLSRPVKAFQEADWDQDIIGETCWTFNTCKDFWDSHHFGWYVLTNSFESLYQELLRVSFETKRSCRGFLSCKNLSWLLRHLCFVLSRLSKRS